MKALRPPAQGRLVLLVGGDLETARSCARAAQLPVIRARHVGTAAEHLRSLRPVALLLASDLPAEDAAELERLAGNRARVVHIDVTCARDVDAEIRSAVGHR